MISLRWYRMSRDQRRKVRKSTFGKRVPASWLLTSDAGLFSKTGGNG